MRHLVLIDGHHLMYRAYYAIPKTLRTAKGEQTNAVYGVATMLLTMLKAEQPDALLFCFDAGEETFRHKEHAEYKAGRSETPDDFYLQIPRILQMIDAFQLQHLSDAGFEADDLLCAYAKEGEKAGMRVTIVTGDRDAFQLATENVRVAIPHKGYQQPEYLGPKEIFAKYGIRPDQVAAYKGLSGDASDNLPGVKGIGPKTAAQLLQKYETLEGIYAHLSKIRGGVHDKLERDREQAFFCQRMATLHCVPLKIPLEQLTLQNLPTTDAIALFRELEFQSLIARLEAVKKTPFGMKIFRTETDTELVQKEADQLSLF